ncbi:holin family protein [Desulfosporosinus acididurans]|uniref:Holin family protein n=1 Tax=Desulfosporosinus acididurans TaxID=476652 RepID=A0A0J1FU02_9FIRM|nr:phage holin family protein [Desulfosporosinus acididurans]KLU66777.1 holin family protein [Desulfosporosinus acididurans]
MENTKRIAVTVGAILSWLVGGLDYLFQTLVIFIVIDYASGVAAAWIGGELSSSRGLRGIAKKTFIITLVVVADKIDFMLGGSDFWRNAVLWALIVNETFSILENGGRMGVKIPKVFYKALAVLQDKNSAE